jgi:hypothetical protein
MVQDITNAQKEAMGYSRTASSTVCPSQEIVSRCSTYKFVWLITHHVVLGILSLNGILLVIGNICLLRVDGRMLGLLISDVVHSGWYVPQ